MSFYHKVNIVLYYLAIFRGYKKDLFVYIHNPQEMGDTQLWSERSGHTL